VKTYPINLINLDSKLCIVVGGGPIAERRARELIACEVCPLVISPELTGGLHSLLEMGHIRHRAKEFEPDDLENAFLVIAATDNQLLNQSVAEAAHQRGALVNVVDTPELCDFYTPSILRRGDFVISISTGGACPALAAHTRADLEAHFGEEYEVFIDWCRAVRRAIKTRDPDLHTRRAIWKSILNSPLLRHLHEGRIAEARALVEDILGPEYATNLTI